MDNDTEDLIPAGYDAPLPEPTDDEVAHDQSLRRSMPEAQEPGTETDG